MPTRSSPSNDAPLTANRRPAKAAAKVSGADALEKFELVGRTVTIARPREELFRFWRDLTNLAAFMENIESIQVLDGTRSHWVVKAPAGQSVEWDAIIDEERPNELLSWTSTAESSVKNAGRVEFRDAPGGRGTQVTATILYDAPAGKLGALIAKLFQREPKLQARRDLRRFKQLMETGEIATAEPPDAAPRAS
jgi:uncharacterized membrane protein